jgi:aspartate aminotransferase-like enzyme
MARAIHRAAGDVFTWPASGSAGWEAAIVNLLSPGDPVLATICGAFGERFAQVGERFGLDVRRLDAPWGQAIDPDALRQALARNPGVKAVFLTHNETSTGVVNPLAELAAAARDHGALTVVDAVSSAGGLPLETDAWGLDFVFSGSQKAWMCPPGLMIAAVGPRAWDAYERARFPRFFWDLGEARRAAEQGMTPTTPPLTMIYAYHAALGLLLDEGLENVWERHRRLGEIARAGARAAGLRLFADPAHASDTVTAVLPPEGFRARDVLAGLRERGVEAQGGQGAMADSLVRIGHMGWAHEDDIREAMDALRDVAAALTTQAAPVAG